MPQLITQNQMSTYPDDVCGPFYSLGLTLIKVIPAWASNDIHYKVWGEITSRFLNFNDAIVEV